MKQVIQVGAWLLICQIAAAQSLVVTDMRWNGTNCAMGWNDTSNLHIVAYSPSLTTGSFEYVGSVVTTNSTSLTNPAAMGFYAVRSVDVVEFADAELESEIWSALTGKFSPTNALYDIDVETITELHCYSGAVSNMTGLGALRNLEMLYCQWNHLETLSLVANTNIWFVECSGNLLTNLDTTAMGEELTWLACAGNLLTELDVSSNTALRTLLCGVNQLAELDLLGLTSLETLSCYDNMLTTLSLPASTNLAFVHCGWNSILTQLDVSEATNIEELYCQESSIETLDLSGLSHLDYLYCYRNNLTNLTLTGCASLLIADCSSNALSQLDLSSCSSLVRLYCTSNELNTLDCSSCPVMSQLYCNNNRMTNLAFGSTDSLRRLDCSNNLLTNSLDLSGFTNMSLVIATSNSLSEIIVWDTNDLPTTFLYDAGVTIREP